MKDIIQDRLNKVANLNERKIMKNVLYDVFENIVDYNMDMYDKLESRIYDEISDPKERLYIYSCLDNVSNTDPVSNFLHPMLSSDLDEAVYDMDDFAEKLKTGREIVLASVFMECDYLKLKEILSQKKTYKAYIKTDKNIHEASVTLRHCTKYIKEIERLYKTFQYNGVGWNTVNCPYAYKFADIFLNSSIDFKPGEKVMEISVDLGEYEKYKVPNVIPFWNIKQITATDKSFPMPAKDKINYEHKVALTELGVQNGYMAGLDNSEFLYCKRLEYDLIIISSSVEHSEWNLVQIEDISNNRKKHYDYELLSNRRELGFIGRYASVKSMVVRTKAELSRMLQAYSVSKELHFCDLEINEKYDKEEETSDCNSFVDDNIRLNVYKKIMLIKFKSVDRESFLTQDKMSFLVSEVQILFPEYKCIGELI